MTWFKVDDGFAFHPKALALSPAAGWLWVRSGSWSAQQLTNGRVPAGMVLALGATEDHAAELVAAGLWKPDGSDWLFHDWEKYQPSREQVEGERVAARERQRRGREAARAARENPDGSHGVTDPEVLAQSHDESRVSRPVPSRPVLPDGSMGAAPGPKPRRSTAVPKDFTVTPELRAWAKQNAPRVNVDRQTEKFLNHHGAKGSVFKDWVKAWRNWMLNAVDYGHLEPGTEPVDQSVPEAWR